VALVTGASRGIGAAAARRLAAEGARVALVARTLHEREDAPLPGSLHRTAAEIAEAGGEAIAVGADLSQPDQRAHVVPQVTARLGPVEVLVNNAAAAIYAPAAEMALRHRHLLFELNVHAPVDLAQAVLPAMRASRQGWIVNVSSATSTAPPGPPFAETTMATVPYGASKAALERFSVGLAAEVHADGIAVNCIAPVAAVRTEGAAALVGDRIDEDRFEPIEMIVDSIVYLASCPPEECTGQVLLTTTLRERFRRG
jgi:citronellol/citronellal dehydrogenase